MEKKFFFRQNYLVASLLALLLQFVLDIFYFKIQSIQGYVFILILNALIQHVIHYLCLALPNKIYNFQLCKLLIIILLNSLLLFYKINFINSLTSSGIADGSADLIARHLFECNFCQLPQQINLNEVFIVYVYIIISYIAGEFNHNIIWLVFNVFLFFTAYNVFKIIQKYYPNIVYPYFISILLLLFTDTNAANLALFKDNIVIFFISLFFLINMKLNQTVVFGLKDELLIIFTIIMMYSLRSGLLPLIMCLYLLNLLFNTRKVLQITRIFFISFCLIFILNQYGYVGKLSNTVQRVAVKISPEENSLQDSHNYNYTVSKEKSLIYNLGSYNNSLLSLPYSFILKSVFTFALPLPVDHNVNLSDFLYKIATLFYLSIFPFVLIGCFIILKNRRRDELYLLTFFIIILITILSAGEFIYPRYRIMILPFYLIIFGIGISSISKKYTFNISFFNTVSIFFVLTYYYEIYRVLYIYLN